MIYDAENMFCDKAALTSGEIISDTVFIGVGENVNPLYLFIQVNGRGLNGTLKTVLETSDTEDFTEVKKLASYEETPVKAKIPHGSQKYLRLKLNSTYTEGTVTAAMVYDVEL